MREEASQCTRFCSRGAAIAQHVTALRTRRHGAAASTMARTSGLEQNRRGGASADAAGVRLGERHGTRSGPGARAGPGSSSTRSRTRACLLPRTPASRHRPARRGQAHAGPCEPAMTREPGVPVRGPTEVWRIMPSERRPDPRVAAHNRPGQCGSRPATPGKLGPAGAVAAEW